MNIRFIYFDVGGVVMLDFSKTNKWNEMWDGIGIKSGDRPRLEKIFREEESKFCSGGKSSETFVNILKNDFGITVPENYSFLDEFVNRFEPNTELAKILVELKKRFSIGLLTNMYPDMLNRIIKRKLLPDIDWDVVIDSSTVGLIKPQDEIFNYAAEKARVTVKEILFVENSQKHVDKARKLGWNTLLYDPSDTEKSNKDLLYLLN